MAVRVSTWSAAHPVAAILLISLISVVINCYPVIFCGKSYVSPDCVPWMVYNWWPPLPGMDDASRQNNSVHGSDAAAVMWWGIPAGFVESRSLLQHGELPLWNRYSHAGDTFIGQAVSMLGDPLQWIVILGRGSAAAWDIKFIVAKFLFCAGFGLLILRLLANLPLSLIFAALSAYCGAYFYINNHPAFFVLCYAPWILLSALAWLDLKTDRSAWWGVVWLLANFACFNAGDFEAAAILIGGLNMAAVTCALAGCGRALERAKVIRRMGLGTVLFLGLTAPMWISFLVALKGAYSMHAEVRVVQLPVVTLLGLFDDLFFRLPLKSDAYAAVAPGTGLLVMTGCFYSAVRWRQLKGEIFFWVNSGAILLWSGCIFGWVPAPIIAAIPFVNRVGHLYTDFAYLLVIHLTIQSAFGFRCLARENNFRRVTVGLLWVGLIFGIMLLAFCFGITHRPMAWLYVGCAVAGAIGAPMLFSFLNSHLRRIPAAGWAGIIILGFVPQFRFGLYNFGPDKWLMLPGPREVLNAPSRSVDKIQSDSSGPFRVVGMGFTFAGDYSAVYGLEDIHSCAPLSNGEFINLIREFPGMKFGGEGGWEINITSPVVAQPLLNALDVKYLLLDPRTDLEIRVGVDYRIAGRDDFLVLENLDAWPRAFFTDRIAVNASTGQFVQQLQENDKQPLVSLSQTEVNQQPDLWPLEKNTRVTVVPATNYTLLPNSTAFDVRAPSAGVVCLMEGQAKDFAATANGEAKEVLTVNRAFKGVYLDKPGDYHIEFVYRPRYWWLACTWFWISLAGVIVWTATTARHTRQEQTGSATG